MDTHNRPHPMGVEDIAETLGVSKNTVVTWRRRSKKDWVNVPRFPEPDGQLSGRDWWWPEAIEAWARRAGRWSHGDRTVADLFAEIRAGRRTG